MSGRPALAPAARALPGLPLRRRRHGGFTLVELVVVMVLLTVLTTIGLGRMAPREPFAVQGTADQIVSGLRLAQAQAVARRAPVHVQLTAAPAALTVCLDAGCTQPLAPPGGGTWLDSAGDVQLVAALAFSFDATGAPSFATAQKVQVRSSDGSVGAPAIVVEAGSGHVHSP